MTYPAPAPTLSGNLLTVHRMLTNPAYIRRRLRDFNDMRFVSDQVLTQRLRAEGGAVHYEQSEPFVTDRPVRGVSAGSEFPIANLPTGTSALAAVTKWGQKVKLTFEKVNRSRYPGEEASKAIRTVLNTVVNQVDTVTWAAIASAVTATHDVGTAAWVGATPTFLRDILQAKAKVTNLKLGYMPDTLLMRDDVAAYVMSDDKVTNALRRETRDSPIYSGELDVLADLAVITSPSAPTDPYIFDSTEVGGMADEQEEAPGYSPAEMNIQVKAWVDNDLDCWWLQGRRLTVPAVREPGAAIRIVDHGVA